MKGLLAEIEEIPQRAADCLAANRKLSLPKDVPYAGMGSSYFAPLTLYYCGCAINPVISSEYFYYIARGRKPRAVLLSQSGQSSETLWNLARFEHVTAITNDTNSPLAKAPNVTDVVPLASGPEAFPSTKSYVNTLITLYLGLGIDPSLAIDQIKTRFDWLRAQAAGDAKQILKYLATQPVNGLYVIGSGPNCATAMEAALTLSQATKRMWCGLSAAQYDHGPKETAADTVVIVLNPGGKDAKRLAALTKALAETNALVIELKEELPEVVSPLLFITRLNWIMNYLADGLKVKRTFQLGNKITTVDNALR